LNFSCDYDILGKVIKKRGRLFLKIIVSPRNVSFSTIKKWYRYATNGTFVLYWLIWDRDIFPPQHLYGNETKYTNACTCCN
jgi:hypothetical protein